MPPGSPEKWTAQQQSHDWEKALPWPHPLSCGICSDRKEIATKTEQVVPAAYRSDCPAVSVSMEEKPTKRVMPAHCKQLPGAAPAPAVAHDSADTGFIKQCTISKQ